MFKLRLTATIAIAGTSAAVAAIPSPALMGVERILIACEVRNGFSDAEQRNICAQLVRKAALATDLPVAVATPADVNAFPGKFPRESLLLRVGVDAKDIGKGRKALHVSVTPIRPMMPVGPLPTITSTASLVQVQGDWLVQGPIDAFHKLLGSTGGRRVRAPLTAD